jgi:predicted nucleic acid-binding Zn ribbon protein
MPDREKESPEQLERLGRAEGAERVERTERLHRVEQAQQAERIGRAEPVGQPETDTERRRRRAQFLRDLTEARELRDRVQPRRAKAARLRHAMRMRTFRW